MLPGVGRAFWQRYVPCHVEHGVQKRQLVLVDRVPQTLILFLPLLSALSLLWYAFGKGALLCSTDMPAQRAVTLYSFVFAASLSVSPNHKWHITLTSVFFSRLSGFLFPCQLFLWCPPLLWPALPASWHLVEELNENLTLLSSLLPCSCHPVFPLARWFLMGVFPWRPVHWELAGRKMMSSQSLQGFLPESIYRRNSLQEKQLS